MQTFTPTTNTKSGPIDKRIRIEVPSLENWIELLCRQQANVVNKLIKEIATSGTVGTKGEHLDACYRVQIAITPHAPNVMNSAGIKAPR